MTTTIDRARVSYGRGRQALLEAAVSIGAERGLRGLTLRAVAARAGVDNSLIRRHFGGREGLLGAALDFSTQHSIAATDLDEATTHPSRFLADLTHEVEHRTEHLVFQYEMILESHRTPAHRPAVRKLYRAYFQAICPSATKVEPALTRARFAALDGLVIQRLCRAISADEFRESIEALLQTFSPHPA